MPRTASDTRERLLDAAQRMINQSGFAATSVDRIIEEVGVTKGAFFHHFKTKNDLARALIERFAAGDGELLRSSLERADRLAEDPLQRLLIFVGLMLEVAEELDATPSPGCLFATYCYESGIFEPETRRVVSDAMLEWRRLLGARLRVVAAAHPPRREVDLDSLADHLTVVFEGAYVLARALPGKRVFSDQIRHYRNYLALLFE